MKWQGEIEAAVCDGIARFQQDYIGRGPRDIHAHLVGTLLVVRLQGVLTPAERQLIAPPVGAGAAASTGGDGPAGNGQDSGYRGGTTPFFQRITGCHVVVAQPHRHHRGGRLSSVRIDVVVPGGEIVVNRDQHLDHTHEDVFVALRDAFAAARRRRDDHVRRMRGDEKRHPTPAPDHSPPEEIP